MKQAGEKEKSKLLSYLLREPESNVYILGDLKAYGLCDPIKIFYSDENGYIDHVIMGFGKSYVISVGEEAENVRLKDFFMGKEVYCISGMRKCLEKVLDIDDIFPKCERVFCDYMIKYHSHETNNTVGESMRLKENESYSIWELLRDVDEFGKKWEGSRGLKKIQDTFVNGAWYGVKSGQKLIAVMALSAKSEKCAMVDNVAVKKEYRGKGIGSEILTSVCTEALGKLDFLAVYTDNPIAKKLYNNTGFMDYGEYALWYPVSRSVTEDDGGKK